VNPYIKSLELLAGRFQSAEAEVVKAYFAKPREKKEDIRWLKAQAFKEHCYKAIVANTGKDLPPSG